MKLPNAEQAQVDDEKVIGYLLSASHPDGRSKAEFFARFGFSIENWRSLQEALRQHGARWPLAQVVESPYGTRYIVDGELGTPDGRNPRVRTVWIIEQGSTIPRLVTAHPGRR